MAVTDQDILMMMPLDNVMDTDEVGEELARALTGELMQRDEDDKENEELGAVQAPLPMTFKELANSNYWIGDIGTTTFFTSNKSGMVNTRVPVMVKM